MVIDNKKKVENLLKNNPKGLTIQDISNSLKLARQTISIILAEFIGAGKIEMREIGKAKLHSWKKI